jgi:hypothetical protein
METEIRFNNLSAMCNYKQRQTCLSAKAGPFPCTNPQAETLPLNMFSSFQLYSATNN